MKSSRDTSSEDFYLTTGCYISFNLIILPLEKKGIKTSGIWNIFIQYFHPATNAY